MLGSGSEAMVHDEAEVRAAVERYIAVRDDICAGKGTWADLAQFFTDDAVFIDPAWGRVEGLDEMRRTVFGEAMVGSSRGPSRPTSTPSTATGCW